MKKLLLVLMITCTAKTLLAQNNSKQDPFLTKSLSGESIRQVEAQTAGGNISVESVAAGDARVEVFIWVSNRKNGATVSKEEIQKRLEEYYDLNIDVNGNIWKSVV